MPGAGRQGDRLPGLLGVLVCLLLITFFVPSAEARPKAQVAASYLTKVHQVAQDYWNQRRPASSCADRPIELQVLSPKHVFDLASYSGPIGACQQPYDPVTGCTIIPPDPTLPPPEEDPANPNPANCNTFTPFVHVSTTSVARGWLFFCTVVIQGWGYLTGELHSSKPGNVMYPVISKRNYQRRACGRRP